MAMFPPQMPVPVVEPLTEPFWSACREQRLVIQRCRDCGSFRHLPHVMCGRCQSSSYDWVQSAGRGSVYTYTIVTHAVHEATSSVIPYNVVVVQLDDCGGVLVPGNVLDCDPADVHVGMAVELAWERLSDEITFPRFRRR
jgi:hypothetical protein